MVGSNLIKRAQEERLSFLSTATSPPPSPELDHSEPDSVGRTLGPAIVNPAGICQSCSTTTSNLSDL